MNKNVMKATQAGALKPFVKWAGGKSQLLNELSTMLDSSSEKKITKYCEPMVGGGAFLYYILSKYDFEDFYISDKNIELINTYQVIKNNVIDLVESLNELQNSFISMDQIGRHDFYYDIRDKFNNIELNDNTSVEKAAYFIFLNKTCFNGLYRVNLQGKFNVPMGDYKKPAICDEANLRNISVAIKNVNIVCGDYSLSKKFIDKNTFVYLDPPYRPISSTSNFNAYNADIFDDNEQRRLANFINEINTCGAKIVLSNSDPKNTIKDDSFFDELYKSYTIRRVIARRMINSNAGNRGELNELLIYN